jgi:hypothetical protein
VVTPGTQRSLGDAGSQGRYALRGDASRLLGRVDASEQARPQVGLQLLDRDTAPLGDRRESLVAASAAIAAVRCRERRAAADEEQRRAGERPGGMSISLMEPVLLSISPGRSDPGTAM